MTVKKYKNKNCDLKSLRAAAQDFNRISGFTHNFYNYPARFSPLLANETIRAFTKPGDLIYDPFMGGGTSLVEASVLGRHAVGSDISELATFISNVKTTLLSQNDSKAIDDWVEKVKPKLNLHNSINQNLFLEDPCYPNNMSCKKTWPIRKSIEQITFFINKLENARQKVFVRCALLKTGQWALDSRKLIPQAKEFRFKFFTNLINMEKGQSEYRLAFKSNGGRINKRTLRKATCLNRSAEGIENDPFFSKNKKPKLILTSPPYPGVHVLYHRWQIKGRKETQAPFWIIDGKDGNGASFYTFGGRQQKGLENYFQKMLAVYKSISKVCNSETLLTQVVGFSNSTWQLTKFLQTLKKAGFREIKFGPLATAPDGRLWRLVPNQKWYTDQKGSISSDKEVVLFHKLA